MRALRCLLVLLAVPVLLPAGQGETPPPGWKEYRPKDNSFSVWLPGQGGSRQERQRTMTLRGLKLEFTMVQVSFNRGPIYSAATILLPGKGAGTVSTQERLDLLRDAFVSEVNGRVAKEIDIKQGSLSGMEYSVFSGQGQAKMRLFSQGDRLYRVIVFGSPLQVESQLAVLFLNSYKVPVGGIAKTNPKNVTGTTPSASRGTGGAGGAVATIIPGDTMAFIQAAVKEKRTADVDITGFKLSKELYRDVPQAGGILVGFQLGLGQFVNNPIINGLRPIYLTKAGEKRFIR